MSESKIPKFRRCVIQNFPFIEEDFDALTDYGLLCKVVQYLNVVIDHQNAVDEHVEGLVEGFEELKSYVDNYFANLDVQEEINNKLEDMAEGGELAGIIAQFLELAPVFGYATISDMASATNLSNGCIARVLGNSAAINGDGAFYSIRTKTGADDPDGVNLVAIGDSLVGVRIPDAGLNSVASDLNTLESTVDSMSTRIGMLDDKKWVFIGDSYAEGYSPDGTVIAWPNKLKALMGLANDRCTIAAHGGAGFANPSYPFYRIVSEMSADSRVTDVLIAGGANDTDSSLSSIRSGVQQTMANCATKFPNARVHVAWIGGRMDQYHGYIHLANSYWQKACTEYHANYLPNLQYILFFGGRFSSDGVHPNQDGQAAIANGLYQALGDGYNFASFDDVTFTSNTDMFNEVTRNFHKYSINQISYLANYVSVLSLSVGSHDAFEWTRGGSVKIGSLSRVAGIIGCAYTSNSEYNIGHVIVHDTTLGWRTINCCIYIDSSANVYLRMQPQTEAGSYLDLTCDNIQIPTFTINYITDLM